MSTAYHILLFAHLVCVVGGFGFLAYSGLTLTLARRRGAAAGAVLEVNRQVTGLAEILLYGVVIFGIAAVGSSHHVWSFSQTWVWLSLVLYVAELGLLHGVIRPRQRRLGTVSAELAAAPAASGGGRPPQLATLEGLERTVGLGWGAFNVVALVVIGLMVWQPGA